MRILPLAVSALVLSLAPVAHAQAISRTIPVVQTDLSDDTSVGALHARVVRAALAVCREAHLNTTPQFARTVRACAAETAEAAIAEAAIPALSAYHAAQAMAAAAPTTIAAR